MRRPKDAKAGLASGLKSIGKGLLGGAVSLFAAPAVGAHQDGFVGFAKGAVAGVAGAVLLPVTGVVVGGTQSAHRSCWVDRSILVAKSTMVELVLPLMPVSG